MNGRIWAVIKKHMTAMKCSYIYIRDKNFYECMDAAHITDFKVITGDGSDLFKLDMSEAQPMKCYERDEDAIEANCYNLKQLVIGKNDEIAFKIKGDALYISTDAGIKDALIGCQYQPVRKQMLDTERLYNMYAADKVAIHELAIPFKTINEAVKTIKSVNTIVIFTCDPVAKSLNIKSIDESDNNKVVFDKTVQLDYCMNGGDLNPATAVYDAELLYKLLSCNLDKTDVFMRYGTDTVLNLNWTTDKKTGNYQIKSYIAPRIRYDEEDE